MPNLIRTMFLQSTNLIYRMIRPVIFMHPPQQSHEEMLAMLGRLDDNSAAQFAFEMVNRVAFSRWPVEIGGVLLPHPFILAAGFVRGYGFNDEEEALEAVQQDKNILPGWRTIPSLVGPVEFGSFTRWPQRGNFGTVVWREARTQSTRHRVGLKNPGAVAAAHFLSLGKNKAHLPKVFGINIAPIATAQDFPEQSQDIIEALDAFLNRGVYPSWFTLNLSTEMHQNQADLQALIQSVSGHLRKKASDVGREIPLWCKVPPALSSPQYENLMCVFHQSGVKAVIATDTLSQVAPGYVNLDAGVGGGNLHPYTVEAIATLSQIKQKNDYGVDIVGCGGIQDPVTYRAVNKYDVIAVQYWTTLIYRGPLAAARILNDIFDVLLEKYGDKSP